MNADTVARARQVVVLRPYLQNETKEDVNDVVGHHTIPLLSLSGMICTRRETLTTMNVGGPSEKKKSEHCLIA